MTLMRAMGLGWTEALSLWPATLLLFAARAAEALLDLGLLLLAVGAIAQGGWHALAPGAMFALTAGLFARALGALIEGGALAQAAARLRGGARGGLLSQVLSQAGRSWAYLAMRALLEVGVVAWKALAISCGAWAYALALTGGAAPALPSAGLALALVLVPFPGFLAALWAEVAFARSVARGEGMLVALYEAAGALWKQPWKAAAVLMFTGGGLLGAQLALGTLTRLPQMGSRAPSLSLLLSGEGVAAVWVAFAAAVAALWRLCALLALELGDGAPSPDAVPVAPLVLPAAGAS